MTLTTEFRKLKGKDGTEACFHEECTNWDMDNERKDRYNATKTVTKESIHALSILKKSNNSKKKDGKQI